MTVAQTPICAYCIHRTGPFSCRAFDRIPVPILLSEFDHRREYPGDNGIVFDEDPMRPMPPWANPFVNEIS